MDIAILVPMDTNLPDAEIVRALSAAGHTVMAIDPRPSPLPGYASAIANNVSAADLIIAVCPTPAAEWAFALGVVRGTGTPMMAIGTERTGLASIIRYWADDADEAARICQTYSSFLLGDVTANPLHEAAVYTPNPIPGA